MGLPDVDAATARALAEQAVERLTTLHRWHPPSEAAALLDEELDHGGFTGREALLARIDRLDVPAELRAALIGRAERAPDEASTTTPVHADCHWGNWLADGTDLTALLDFEWARWGDPLDDWFFLISESGPHTATVLDVVARATSTDPEELWAACRLRQVAHLVSDLLIAQSGHGTPARNTASMLLDLAVIAASGSRPR